MSDQSSPVRLRPIEETHFGQARQRVVQGFSKLLQEGRGMSLAEASAEAESQLDHFLPQGLATPGHLWLEFAPTSLETFPSVGFLWAHANPSAHKGCLFWIEVEPAHRRQGYASAALRELLRLLRGGGIERMTLELFAHNRAALALYESCGFRVIGFSMEAQLKRPSA